MQYRTMLLMTKGVVLTVLLSTATGCMAMGSNNPLGLGASWKEEVLLHDGQKIIVQRSQTFGGFPTIDSRERVILEEEWVFPVPGTGKKIPWKTDHRNPPQGESLMLVLVGFFDNIPYIATSPAGCISYNHWKRPNPPYVFFKYDGKEWRQIPLAEFPPEFKEANVAVGRPDHNHRTGLLTVETGKEENRNLEPHLRQIVREPIKVPQTVECPDLNSPRYTSPKAPFPISPPNGKNDGN